MCDLCLIDAEELGEIIPGVHLHRARKARLHAHEGDLVIEIHGGLALTWGGDLASDPFDGMSDGDINALPPDKYRGMEAWHDLTDAFAGHCTTNLSLNDAFDISMAAVKAGYNRDMDGYLHCWLFHRMGLCYEKWKKAAGGKG